MMNFLRIITLVITALAAITFLIFISQTVVSQHAHAQQHHIEPIPIPVPTPASATTSTETNTKTDADTPMDVETPDDKIPHKHTHAHAHDRFTLPAASRVVAIGDIHGDLLALAMILSEASIVSSQGTWIGGNTVVVMTGDLTDRARAKERTIQDEASEYTVYYWLIALNEQAHAHGGAVHILMGNHELMNIQGYTSYASAENIRDTGGSHAARKAEFKPGKGRFALLLAEHVHISIMIGSWLFVHAGWTPAVVHHLRRSSSTPTAPLELASVNDALHAYLTDTITTRVMQQQLSALLDQEHGPMWSRAYGYEVDEHYIGCSAAVQALPHIHTPHNKKGYPTHMVIGHTPQYTNHPPQGINVVHCTHDPSHNKQHIRASQHTKDDATSHDDDLEIWRIDIGQSRAFERLPKPVTGPIKTKSQQQQHAEYMAWPGLQQYRRPAALEIRDDVHVEIIIANHTAYQHTQYYPHTWSIQPVNLTHLYHTYTHDHYNRQHSHDMDVVVESEMDVESHSHIVHDEIR